VCLLIFSDTLPNFPPTSSAVPCRYDSTNKLVNIDPVTVNIDRVPVNIDQVPVNIDQVPVNIDQVPVNIDQLIGRIVSTS
jgi:hypothetical protein